MSPCCARCGAPLREIRPDEGARCDNGYCPERQTWEGTRAAALKLAPGLAVFLEVLAAVDERVIACARSAAALIPQEGV